MSSEFSRRSFIKNTTILGSGILAGMSPLSALAAPAADLAVVKGADGFKNTIKAVELIGGMGRYVPKGSKVGLLINYSFSNPGAHASPDVALAVVKMCFDAGASRVQLLKDEPMSYWRMSDYGEGLKKYTEKLTPCSGEYVEIKIPKGKFLKQGEIIKDVMDNDLYINVSVAKHHEGTGYSGVLKNAMGLCPHSTCRFFHFGHNKGGWFGDVDFLSQCVADLNQYRPPALCINDAGKLIAGGGPSGPGRMVSPGKVAAGADPVAVDAYCTRFLGLTPEDVSMVGLAAKAGLGAGDLKKVKIKEAAA